MDLRQTRKMTDLGFQQYEQSVSNFTSKLLDIKETSTLSLPIRNVDLAQGQNIIDNIHKHLEYYELLSDKYITYLRGHRTVESSNEEASHRLVRSSLCDKTAAFVNQLQSALPKMESSKAPSLVPSVISGKSGSSQLTAVWMQHSANVEKAKARLKYAAEEAELIKQEAALKASRNLLTVKRELEEAESGLSAICKVLDFSQSATKSVESDHGSYKPPVSSKFHVLRYMDDNRDDCTPLQMFLLEKTFMNMIMTNLFLKNLHIHVPSPPCVHQKIGQMKQTQVSFYPLLSRIRLKPLTWQN